VQNGRPAAAPLTGIPSDRAELVVAMAKGDRAGGLVRPHRVKRKDDLAAALHPATMLGHAVFANVKGIEDGCAVRSQVEGKDPFCCVCRRCVALIGTAKVGLLPPEKADSNVPGRTLRLRSGATGRDEPAKRQEKARMRGTKKS
jgi:hypothetical protein